MKLLLTIIFVVSFFTVVLSQQCDSRGITGLQRCYNNMLKSLNVPFSSDISQMLSNMQTMDQQTFCRSYDEKNKCLGDDYKNKCINSIAFTNAFGITATESVQFLMVEYFNEYLCSNIRNFRNQCKFDNAALFSRCRSSSNNGCESVSSALQCFNNAMADQCNDRELVEYVSNGLRYMFQKVVPFCGV